MRPWLSLGVLLSLLAGCDASAPTPAPERTEEVGASSAAKSAETNAPAAAHPVPAAPAQEQNAPAQEQNAPVQELSAPARQQQVAPPPSPAMAEAKLLATLDQGCNLVGATDAHVYLTPGLLGSKRVLRVSMDGTADEVRFEQRFKPLAVTNDKIYGCAGKRQDLDCRVVTGLLSGGALETVTTRGKVTKMAVAGDKLWTIDYTDENKLVLQVGELLDGDTTSIALEQPMAMTPMGQGVIVTTGGTVKTWGVFLVAPTGRVITVVKGKYHGAPVTGGPWIYMRGGRDELIRLPNGGGEPEVLQPAPEKRGLRFGLVANATQLFWLQPGGDLKPGAPTPRRLVMALPKPD